MQRFPLHQAAFDGDLETVREILDRHARRGLDDLDDDGQTALMRAASMGHEAIVRALAGAGARLDAKDTRYGHAALHKAVAMRRHDVIAALLELGAEVDVVDRGGLTPLMLAAGYGDEALAVRLIEGGAQVDRRAGDGRTALGEAALATGEGAVALVRRLLRLGAVVEATDQHGRTPLHGAALAEAASVDALLAAGADPRRPDAQGRSPIDVALAAARPALARRMMTATGDAADPDALLVATAGQRDDEGLAGVRELLADGAHPDARSGDGETALDAAIRSGSPEVARALLAAGADADAPTACGSALHAAVSSGQVETIALLVAEGADPRRADAGGRTALDLAVAAGRPDLVRLLQPTDRAISPEQRAAELLGAAARGDAEAIETTLRAHPEHATLALYRRALAHADPRSALAVLRGGLLARALEAGDATPLVAALDFRRIHPAVVRALLESGMDPNAPGSFGATAFSLLCGEADQPPGDRPIGLDDAARDALAPLIALALARGAEPNRRNGLGETPLHLAAERRTAAAVRALLEAGADPDATDRAGRTALARAARRGHGEVEALLREHAPTRGC